MNSIWIKRKLTRICGNILLYVYEDRVELGSDLSSSALSDKKYKNVVVGDNYADDIQRVFSDTKPSILFSGYDENKDDTMLVATLMVTESLPSRAVIMKKNGSDEEKDHTIYKSFEFSDKTPIGKYLTSHLSQEEVKKRPIFIDFQKKIAVLNGVDVATGSICEKNVKLENITNENITKLFEQENVIPSNIFQMVFQKPEGDDYYLMFVNDLVLGSFIPKPLDSNFIPLTKNTIFGGEIEIAKFAGTIFNQEEQIAYFFAKNESRITTCTNIVDGKISIKDDLVVNMEIVKEKRFEKPSNEIKTIIFELTERFTQSERIPFRFTNLEFELVADELFNNPDFLKTDNERFIFNPAGTIEEQAVSIAKAFNFMTKSKIHHEAFAIGKYIFIQNPVDYISFDLDSVDSQKLVPYKYSPTPIGSDVTAILVEKDDDFVGRYLKTNIGYHKILFENVDTPISDTFLDAENYKKRLYCDNNYKGSLDLDRIWDFDKIEYGVFSIINDSSLENEIVKNKSIIFDSLRKYLSQDELTVGVEYVVSSGQISLDGFSYSTGDSFVATSTAFTKDTLDAKVFIKRYYEDQEVINFINKYSSDISSNTTVKFDYSWIILGVLDSKQEEYEVEVSQTQNFDIHEFDPIANTHGFYFLSDSFGETFDEEKYSLASSDYFKRYFKRKWTVFGEALSGAETIFNGAKIVVSSDYVSYKFACLVNSLPISDVNEGRNKPLEIKVIKNDAYKNVVLLINLYVSDYKAFDETSIKTTVDYAYIAMMSGIAKINGDFGDLFTMQQIVPSIVFQDPSLNNTSEYRGIRLNQRVDANANPPLNGISFLGDLVRADTWIRSSGGSFGAFIGYNLERKTFISTMVNLHQSTGFYEAGALIDYYVENNTLIVPSNEIYVMSINGTVFDSVIPFSLLKSIESFSDFTWIQVVNPELCYDRIKKLISLAGLYDIFNIKPNEVVSQIESFSFKRPSREGFYDESFIVNTKENIVFDGAVVLQNWYVLLDSWISYAISWDSFPETVDFGLFFDEEININKV